MIWPLGRLGAAATLGQHCPQMTQRRCTTNQFASLVAVVGAGEADPGGQEVGRAGHGAGQAGVQRLTGHVP